MKNPLRSGEILLSQWAALIGMPQSMARRYAKDKRIKGCRKSGENTSPYYVKANAKDPRKWKWTGREIL